MANTIKEKVTDFMVESRNFIGNEIDDKMKGIKVEEKKYIINTQGDVEDVIKEAMKLTKEMEKEIQKKMPSRSNKEEFEGVLKGHNLFFQKRF